MKTKFLCFCLSLSFSASSSPAAAEARVWTVRTYRDGDVVRVAETNGVTAIDFAITPSVPRLSGCTKYVGGWADVLFAEPRELKTDDERILFEMSMPVKCDRTKAFLLPLVRDEDGELFAFASKPAPQLSAPKQPWEFSGAWKRMKTPGFHAGEAGAASQDVYTLESDGVDFTPGKRLVFLGFRLLLRQDDKDWQDAAASRTRKGTVYLGDIDVFGEVIPQTDPFAYADALLPKAGTWKIAAEVRDEFQGVPIREFARTLTYDPTDAASRRQKIAFETGSEGCHWIKWQVTDANDAVANAGEFRHETVRSVGRSPRARRVDASKAPVLGVMRINPDHAGRGVYGFGETAKIEVRVFPKAGEKLTLEWKTLPLQLENVLDRGSVPVPAVGPSGCAAVILSPKRFADRPAYRLVVTAKADGRTVDEQTYFYGHRNANPLARHDRAGEIPNRRAYKRHPYNRTTFCPNGGAPGLKTEANFEKVYRAFLENSSEVATSFTYMLDLRDWEVLPGVFDTYLIDRMFDLAADYGMKATIRAAHCDLSEKNLYRWNKYVRQVASDGTIANGMPYYGAYAVPDPQNTKVWLDAYRALHDRYAGHTAFEGYYIMQPGGESTVIDEPWVGTVSGYDPATAAGFRSWLRAKYGTVDENLQPPRPTFRDGLKPDFRQSWIDFCRYKATLKDEWMKTSVNSIRAYDDDRLTIAYCAPRQAARLLGDKLDYGHNGGNHNVLNLYEYIDAWKDHRIGWITEPHHPHCWCAYGDPTGRGWVLDWSTWIMTAQAAGGGANIHVYYHPWKTLERVDFWGGAQGLDRFETFKPILDELHEMEVFRPSAPVAFLTDAMTLWTKHRTTFTPRLADLRLWQETFAQDNVPYGNYLAERADEYKLVLPNLLDIAMETETFSNLVTSVRDLGARTIITADTGSYVPELFGEKPFQLLKAFGIAAPTVPFCRKGTNVVATFGADGVLAEAGRRLPFETGDRLHAQLLDPEVQKRFWKFRFRWIPETDYFGYYPRRSSRDGRVLATFPDGGAAVTLHKVGKGEVIVFWGVPDFDGDNVKGMIGALAKRAGVVNPLADSPVQHLIEGENKRLFRHYLLLWKDEYGSYVVKAPHIPDGTWFVDEMVTGRRLGLFDGKTVREQGIRVDWEEGYSNLKYLRFSLKSKWKFDTWSDKF